MVEDKDHHPEDAEMEEGGQQEYGTPAAEGADGDDAAPQQPEVTQQQKPRAPRLLYSGGVDVAITKEEIEALGKDHPHMPRKIADMHLALANAHTAACPWGLEEPYRAG